jgi:hypothetical protein
MFDRVLCNQHEKKYPMLRYVGDAKTKPHVESHEIGAEPNGLLE